MKILLLCLLFAPILYLAIKYKRWYLYLTFAFAGILPEQFAVSLHSKLPLLSASRILILILFAFWIWEKWKTKKLSFPKSLLLFLSINILVSLVNLRYGTDDIKRIFLYIFERVLLVVMAIDMIRDRQEFERCIDFMIMGCSVLAIIGIVQTVFGYDIVSILHWQTTLTSVTISDRMGLTRAYATFNAISYGCYCAFMVFLIIYRRMKTGKFWYAAAFALNFVALICTFTRSAWLCLGGVSLVLLVQYRWKLLRQMLSSAALAILLCAALCLVQPKFFGGLVETGKSSVNTILAALPDRITSSLNIGGSSASSEGSSNTSSESSDNSGEDTAPGFTLSENFGMNANHPTRSRMAEWTAVQYMTEDGQLLFGYGYNAYAKGRLHYHYDWLQGSNWIVATTLDVGLIALITESGLAGVLSTLGLLGYMLVYASRKRKKGSEFDFYKLTIYMIPLYLLLNFLAAFLNAGAVWLFFGLFYAYKHLDKQGLIMQ